MKSFSIRNKSFSLESFAYFVLVAIVSFQARNVTTDGYKMNSVFKILTENRNKSFYHLKDPTRTSDG